jgi:DNA-binding SARP family transcriptional activator
VPVIGIWVLGPLRAEVDGALVDLGGPRQRCVLARLIAEHGQVVSADRLIEDLYADEAPPRALASVQAYVSHLRRALEPTRAARSPAEVLVTSPPGYAVRLATEAVDAWSFEQAVHQAAGLSDPAAIHARLSTALDSWRGTPFQEFGSLGWADLEAARLAELRLTAVEARADAALRLGRAAQTVPELNQLTAAEPLREEAWRLLALALYQAGRQGDALAALRRARARLAADLGVDPGPALRELEDSILTQDPRLSAPSPPAPSAPSPRAPATATTGPATTGPATTGPATGPARPPAGPVPYIGRNAELTLVTDTARHAAAGGLRIVLVTGDPGAGKTALIDQVSGQLAAQGWAVAAGQCPEHEGAPAGWPWAQALRRLARTVPPDDQAALAALLADDPAPDVDIAAGRFRLHQAVAGYLNAVSQATPLLVTLEDLHRADDESLAMLADVTANLTPSRVLVLASYRPGEVSEQLSGCLATLAAREPVRLTLAGLDAEAAAELIRATCSRPVDAETAQAIAERTAGNAFFIKETARLLDSEGALAATTEVPAGVRDVLQRRIARLPATAQTILRQAAVIGTEADVDVLADVASTGEDILLDAIEAGLLTGLVTEPAPGQVRFTHALVRDTLYQSLSRLRRSRLHARAAEAIERHNPTDVAFLAYHFTQAGTDPGKAARYCQLAASRAEQRFAYHEAARLWEQAVTCLDRTEGADPRGRLELVLHLVRALSHVGRLNRARSYRHDAVHAALPLGDPVLLARVISSLDVPRVWLSNIYGQTDEELVEIVEQTLARLPAGDDPLRCRLLTTLAFELHGAESERGYEASAEALPMARRLGDTQTLVMAINGRYIQSFRHDGLAERVSLGTELLALPGKPVTAEALGHLMLMRTSCATGDFGAADMHAELAGSIADQYDLPLFAVGVRLYQALRVALSGDLSAAAELYPQAGERLSKADSMWSAWTPMTFLALFCILLMQDRAAEIVGYIGSDVIPMPDMDTSNFTELYALVLAAIGQTAEARAAAAQQPSIRPDMLWMFLVAIRGLLGIALDDHARAESAYQALLPYAARPAGLETAMVSLWPTAQILGDLENYLGLPGAEQHYRQALDVADRTGVQLWREAALRHLS